jgi:hypothetical protein
MPEKGTTILIAPKYDLTDEGVLYGFFNELQWKKDSSGRTVKELMPFAFRYTVEGDKLTLKDARLFGVDYKGHQALSGPYSKMETEGASTASKSIKR